MADYNRCATHGNIALRTELIKDTISTFKHPFLSYPGYRQTLTRTFAHLYSRPNPVLAGSSHRQRDHLYHLANALRAALAEDERWPGQQVVREVHESEFDDCALAGLQSFAPLDAHYLGGLAQHPAVDDRLVAAADGGGVVQDDHAGLELPSKVQIKQE